MIFYRVNLRDIMARINAANLTGRGLLKHGNIRMEAKEQECVVGGAYPLHMPFFTPSPC